MTLNPFTHINSQGEIFTLYANYDFSPEPIYYFSKTVKEGACRIPEDKKVIENPKTKTPFLMDIPKSLEEVNEEISININLIAEAKDYLKPLENGISAIKEDILNQTELTSKYDLENLLKEALLSKADKELDVQIAEIKLKELFKIFDDFNAK